MRRWIAVLSLLSLANLVFVRSGSSCPLIASMHHQPQAASASPATHAGHEAGAASGELATSGEESSHRAMCLMMGPCVLTIDVIRPVDVPDRLQHPGTVVARSDHIPASPTLSPELPPPRA